MSRISTSIIGAAGEYYVLSQLLRRGWIAASAPTGAPNIDILITDGQGRNPRAIQVKTRRDTGRGGKWQMQQRHETMIDDDLFYAFVNLGEKPSDADACYILPSQEVADAIRLTHKVWLDTPEEAGGRIRTVLGENCIRTIPPPSSRPPTTRRPLLPATARTGWRNIGTTGKSWPCHEPRTAGRRPKGTPRNDR